MLRGSLHLRSAALVCNCKKNAATERPVDYDLYSPRRPGSTKAEDLSSTKDRRLARLSMKKVKRRWQGKGRIAGHLLVGIYDPNDNNMKKR